MGLGGGLLLKKQLEIFNEEKETGERQEREKKTRQPNDVGHQISLIDCSSLTNSSCLCMTK